MRHPIITAAIAAALLAGGIAQAQPAAGYTGPSVGTQPAQAGKHGNAVKDYQLSKATLDALIARSKGAQEEVIAYEQLLEKPEDFDEPEITGMEPEAYIASTPCHADNKRVIRNVAEDIDFIISDLQYARDLGEDLEKATSGKEANMGSVGTAQGAQQKAGKGGTAAAVDSRARVLLALLSKMRPRRVVPRRRA